MTYAAVVTVVFAPLVITVLGLVAFTVRGRSRRS